ncbi:MAG: LPS-assembly protein LptD [Pseudomonadales bacterium]|nr:LPS-assembly protein LptD [Pseudomonadales bacterium]
MAGIVPRRDGVSSPAMISHHPTGLLSCSPSALLLAAGLWLTLPAVALAAEDTARKVSPQSSGLAGQYWHPRDALSATELVGVPEFCAGAYRWPSFPYPASDRDEDYPVQAQARHGQYWQDGRVQLDGAVTVTQGNRSIAAESVAMDHRTRIGTVDAGVLVEEPALILQGQQASVNLDNKAVNFQDVEFLLIEPEFRGVAEEVDRDELGTLQIDRLSFTRCDPYNNNWRVTARSFEVKEGAIYGVARDAVLRVKDVPVFYTPYLSIPVTDERKSGWLFPTLGFSDQNGIEFAPPYYLNLAPNYDATVVPRYLEKRGMGVDAEFRHRSAWQKTSLYGAWLPSDDEYDGTYDRSDYDDLLQTGAATEPFQPADRWLYAMFHEGDVGNFHTTVNYTAVSDRDYFRNLGTELDVRSRLELERRGEVLYSNEGLDVRLWAQRFDRLDEVTVDPYQRLPELAVNYLGDAPLGLEWSLGASAASFTRDNDDLTGAARVVGDRYHMEPRLRLPLSRSWGFLNLTGGYRYTRYQLNDVEPDVDKDPVRKIGLGSVDTGLYFERDLIRGGASLVHTLEPRVFYLYQQYEDQDDLPQFDVSELTFRYDQLYRDNRFSGIDRIGDADQVSLGLTSRLLRADTGAELVRASIGQIQYFKDRRVTTSGTQSSRDLNSSSQYAAELTGYRGPWALGGDLMWDPHEKYVTEAGGFLRYLSDNDHIVHLGYRYQRLSDVDQTDVGFTWPISRRYALVGRWNYDLNSGRTIEGLGGIEYNDCCWKIRVIGRHYLNTPSAAEFDVAETSFGVYLQVVFKGLAGIGGQVESLLAKSLPGYSAEN